LGAAALIRLVSIHTRQSADAVTISTLKLFHAVSLQGKTTAYHFFNASAKITDNTGSRAFRMRVLFSSDSFCTHPTLQR
jgi:hypothetical protein